MKNKILKALSKVIDPDLNDNLVSLNMIRHLQIKEKNVTFTIMLTTPACPLKHKFIEECTNFIHQDVDPALTVTIKFDSNIEAQKRKNTEVMSGVKNLIAVASGKGGVGKSTIAVNLAISLAKFGSKVGLLDADINGPSLSVMLGVEGQQPSIKSKDEKTILIPIEKFGIKIMSMGMLVPPDQPIIWRGPMLSTGLRQLMLDTEWGDLDYLFIDLPPGTGDIHLTLCQNMPLTAAIIVTTPQKVSLSDTIKTIEMLINKKIDIPILGLIENMAYFTPKELPDNKYYIFGKGGGEKLSKKYNIPLLAKLPLVMGVTESADNGIPSILNENNPVLKEEFVSVAQSVAQKISILHSS